MNRESKTDPTILVTGGCGFIGSNFVRRVMESSTDTRIINLDKLTYAGNLENLKGVEQDSRYRFVKGDICDEVLVNKLFFDEDVDSVVHFAAESHVDRSIDSPGNFIETNIKGTFNLLEAARAAWIGGAKPVNEKRFLHVSTDEVFGSLGDTGRFSETTPYDPRSPYSASKAASDHLVSAYWHTYGLPTIISNCSNNYGPYQFPEKLIPLMINNALSGRELPVYGDGMNVRDWLYVVDHCDAIAAVLEKGVIGETYNVGGDSERFNIDIVRKICDLLDEKVGPLPSGESRRKLIRLVTDRPGHDRRYAIDASKIKSELGWEPAVTFEEGIDATIDWYLSNSEWLAAVMDGSYRDYYEQMYGDRWRS